MRIPQPYFLRILVLWGLAWGWPKNSQAQMSPSIYQHLDQEDGLASSIVLAIMQDQTEYMWWQG
ncbi:hypothetical protein AHMF7616_01340 [Adhaeribacter pallidiroseus]|uniref:Uncharacterized protein n=1 Tax=Adhaeribacter pallidiroseus TaxID=2072847 RepID=A0A369QHQ0_9BACT|nr:hypothetical protein AHMF7616_01340 [Adhaeribacter pallidiroseus]